MRVIRGSITISSRNIAYQYDLQFNEDLDYVQMNHVSNESLLKIICVGSDAGIVENRYRFSPHKLFECYDYVFHLQ